MCWERKIDPSGLTPKPTPETHKGTAEGEGLLSAAKEEKKGHHLARVKVS